MRRRLGSANASNVITAIIFPYGYIAVKRCTAVLRVLRPEYRAAHPQMGEGGSGAGGDGVHEAVGQRIGGVEETAPLHVGLDVLERLAGGFRQAVLEALDLV